MGAPPLTSLASGPVSVTNDATFRIEGSDGAVSAAININGGGSYDAGGTFLAEIDGSGTITFNNASVHANVLQVGALGTNGVLNIGGGTLSADTTLKLYAGGNSGAIGAINFTADVTLGGNSAKILAANSVTIFNGVTVTIAGPNRADVYTNNANYARSDGGNGSTSGTFAGGANNPQPLSIAPPFDSPSARVAAKQTRSARSGGGIGHTIHITDSSQLGSLLENASPGRDGKVRIASAAIPRPTSAGKAPAQTSRAFTGTDRHHSVDTNVGPRILASRLP